VNAQVLNNIQNVGHCLPIVLFGVINLGTPQEVVRNLSNKFEGVKKDVRVGRDRILREAASDLHEIRGNG
jgi:hypothetical protein